MFDPAALASIIEGGGVQYRQNSISYIFECNRCGSASKLYIRKRDGRFVCWKCRETDNYQGKAEWALKELYNFSINELRKKLYGEEAPEQLQDRLVLDFDLGDFGVDEDEVSAEPLPKPVIWPPNFYTFDDGAIFLKGAKYFASRGITIEHVRTYDLRYDPSERRVIFPVKVDGRLIGWQARYIGPTEHFDAKTQSVKKIPKVLTSETLRETGGRYLMFQDRLKGATHCVLAEGPVSALKCHKAGGNVASMGKAVTRNQLKTILSYGVTKLYIGLDTDAADEIMRILRDDLEADLETYLLLPPKGRGDLGDATEDEVLEQFQTARPVHRGTLILSLGSTLAI